MVAQGEEFGRLRIWDLDMALALERERPMDELPSLRYERNPAQNLPVIAEVQTDMWDMRLLTGVGQSQEPGELLVCAATDGSVSWWNPEDLSRHGLTYPQAGPIMAVAAEANGDRYSIFTGDDAGNVWEWDRDQEDLVSGPYVSKCALGGGVRALLVVPGSPRRLISGGADGCVRVWELGNLDPIAVHQVVEKPFPIGAIRYLFLLASAGADVRFGVCAIDEPCTIQILRLNGNRIEVEAQHRKQSGVFR
jgi:WD40 repeat protein